jgi:RNA-binding protein
MTLMPASELRRSLRGHGHAMSAIVHIGKAGVTDGLLKQVRQALADHELIKVKIARECPVDRFDVAARLEVEPGVAIVQLVGRMLLLYKRHPRTPKYEGKGVRAAGVGSQSTAVSRAPARPRRTGKRRGVRAGS